MKEQIKNCKIWGRYPSVEVFKTSVDWVHEGVGRWLGFSSDTERQLGLKQNILINNCKILVVGNL